MSEDIYIDVNYLTESERDLILQVLGKDEELRKQEKRRISTLKNELDEIKKNGAREEEINSSRICARCRVPLGLIFNSGALCPKCEARVCKECRITDSTSWLCVLCAKIRQVRAESGAWFFEQERRKGERPQLYGSALVRASFRRAKPTSQHTKDADPGSPPVISLNLNNHGGKLHRPVPVHMSRLVEKEGEEEEEKKNTEEINQNYKQYVKANQVERRVEEDQSDEQENASSSSHSSTPREINQNYKQYVKANQVERRVEEDQSDEQENASSSSHSSTPRGSPVHDLGNDAVEVPEETVFDHLVNQQDDKESESEEEMDEEIDKHDVPQWANHAHEHNTVDGYSEHEAQGYDQKVTNWEIDREQSRREQVNNEPVVEVKTKWHEVAHEWAEAASDYEHPGQEAYPQKQFLDVRPASPDSETTGEFFTPLASPLHSETATPALSEHEHSEEGMTSGSEYVDAGEATPVEGDRTPVAELSEQDDEVENIADVTVINPEITCSTYPDDGAKPEEGHRTPTKDDDADDIDQAFANYGRDHPNVATKTLQDQLNIISMGSRESIVSYYSDAGEGRFGNITVTGEILFGLRYDKHKYQLEVQIHRAKDIAPADEKKGRSDPYCKVYLLPDKTKGGKRKTKTKKNTLDPDFDEILKFKIGFEEMLTRTIWLTMWNHDTFGHNDFLGEVMLPLDTYQDSGFSWDDPSPNWYPLRERRPEPSLMSYCGDLTVSLMYEPGEESHKDKKKKKKLGGKLHVLLKEARNLPAKDSNGFSDPFVKSYLLPDTSKKTKHKTAVMKKSLNPVWDHSFKYDHLTIEELRNRVLELTVWDYDRGSSNDFLGGLRLGLGNKTEPWDDSQGLEIQAWQMMLDRPNKWHEYTLNLRSSMDSQAD